jgi:hypothetical protein
LRNTDSQNIGKSETREGADIVMIEMQNRTISGLSILLKEQAVGVACSFSYNLK